MLPDDPDVCAKAVDFIEKVLQTSGKLSGKEREKIARVRGLFGARPMSRLLQDKVKRPLADELLFGKLVAGGRVLVDVSDGELVVEARPEPEKLLPATVE